MISVAVLGSLSVRTGAPTEEGLDGLSVLRPRERSVVAALTLRSPSPVAADELIGLVWAGQAPVTARKSLRNHVMRARVAVDNGLVVSRGDGYQLGPRVMTDVRQLQSLVRQARTAGAERRWPDRLELVEAASRLWRGRPYDDLGDAPDVEGERARLTELMSQVEDDLTETLLLLGRPQEAVARLKGLLSMDPYRERRWDQLLAAHFLAGNRRDALGVASAAGAAFSDVGLMPSSALPGWRRWDCSTRDSS